MMKGPMLNVASWLKRARAKLPDRLRGASALVAFLIEKGARKVAWQIERGAHTSCLLHWKGRKVAWQVERGARTSCLLDWKGRAKLPDRLKGARAQVAFLIERGAHKVAWQIERGALTKWTGQEVGHKLCIRNSLTVCSIQFTHKFASLA